MKKLNEECGVFGIFDGDNVSNVVFDTYLGLFSLQHRGQQAAGIAVNNNGKISYKKGTGLASDVFGEKELADLGEGQMAIGHVLYSAETVSAPEYAQPMVSSYHNGKLVIANNGSLSNAKELRKELEENGAIFQTNSDTEIIAYLIARHRKGKKDIVETMQSVMKVLKGTYCLVVMTKHKLLVVRDPVGVRPLVVGKFPGKEKSLVFASESCALDAVGAELVRDIAPGEIWCMSKEKINMYTTDVKPQTCIFEYVYFARPDSYIDGSSVYNARIRAGRQLARECPCDVDVVIGVPDSGLQASIGFHNELVKHYPNVKYATGFIKNRYIGRTFIAPSQKNRVNLVKIKLNALRETVNGKRVAVVDDSIVRGTTSRHLIELLRSAGAKEVHFRLSSPEFLYPCPFGTDVPDKKMLFAHHYKTDEERAKALGAESVGFLSIDGLKELFKGGTRCEFCKGCFTGKYPE